MTTTEIVKHLEEQRDRLNAAIESLNGSGKLRRRDARLGRKGPKSMAQRRLISDAMKKSWAERKRAAKAE